MKRALRARGFGLLGAAILAPLVVHLAPAGAADKASKKAKQAASPAMVLPFIQDDYAKALQEARTRKQPLFIEAWAPW